MKCKRICSMLLSLAMAAGVLSGCGQTDAGSQTKESESQTQSSSVAEASSETVEEEGPITTEPITFEILTSMSTNATVEANDLWFFNYLEYWMNEQGYNVTINVTSALEVDQQLSLMLASDNLPDLVWGPQLSNANAIMYGAEEGMILDWTPYLNEDTMPNLMKASEKNPNALNASICTDGKTYGLPGYVDRGWGQGAGNQHSLSTLFINSKWMEECGYTEAPDTWEDFIDMLRSFKENITLENGQEVIPLVSSYYYLENSIWTGLGYYSYSDNKNKHGSVFAIKDGEVYLPAMTEDYRTYLEIMNTMYTEGLIYEDYLTIDDATARGIMAAGQCGVMGDHSLATPFPDTWSDWIGAKPMTVGDNDTVIGSVDTGYYLNKIWASASTEYPEVLARMVDYIYSPEGALTYYYGPQKGTDPLELQGGWYANKDGNPTNDEVEAGKFADIVLYAETCLNPCLYVGNYGAVTDAFNEAAGLGKVRETVQWPDAILGGTYEVVWKVNYTEDNADGYMRHQRVNNWKDHVTTVKLPTLYMTSEQSSYVEEKKVVLNEYINAESAKFITGARPLSEVDDFFEELKKLGVEEYIEMHREAYAPYMNAIFN